MGSRGIVRKIGVLSVLLTMLLSVCTGFAGAGKGQDTPIRVAYPSQTGLTARNEDGEYTGYTYEYLEEIAQYTGLDYEFVEVEGTEDEQLLTLLGMVERGEIDLMGAVLYSEALGEKFNFGSQSYGVAATVLQAPVERAAVVAGKLSRMTSVRVAILGGGGTRTERELQAYCKMNNLQAELVPCSTVEEMARAVREGRADVLCNSSMNYVEGMRTIARFAEKPFYFITAKTESSGLMAKLDAAILNIGQANPTFSVTLEEKYFTPKSTEIFLSEEERNYLAYHLTLRVGCLEYQAPLQHRQEDGTLHGVSVDLLGCVSEKTGLRFEYVTAATTAELLELIRSDQVDFVAGMPYDYTLARQMGISMTRPYVTTQYVVLTPQAQAINLEGKRLASPLHLPHEPDAVGEFLYYNCIEECAQAVLDGDADGIYTDTYSAQYLVNQTDYGNWWFATQSDELFCISLGVVKSRSSLLLSVLNKAITSMPEEEMQSIVNQNLVSHQRATLSLFVRENAIAVTFTVLIVALLVIALLAFLLRRRAQAGRQAALELKRHLRMYALFNDFFFEYDYQKNVLHVSVPGQNGADAVLHTYRPDGEGTSEEQRLFVSLLYEQRNGVVEMQLADEAGQLHWVRLAMETVLDDNNAPAYTMGKIQIIDSEKKKLEHLEQKARLDSLTQVFNAATAYSRVQAELSALGEESCDAFLLVDVDCFKRINDTFGHQRGDESLIAIARLLEGICQPGDIVGRPGGDEFLAYLHGVNNRQALCRACDRLCRSVRELELGGGLRLSISVGAGLAVQGDAFGALYDRVDKALYKAKAMGRDGYRIAKQ